MPKLCALNRKPFVLPSSFQREAFLFASVCETGNGTDIDFYLGIFKVVHEYRLGGKMQTVPKTIGVK